RSRCATSTPPRTGGSSYSGNCRSRARRSSPTPSSSAPRRRSARSAATLPSRSWPRSAPLLAATRRRRARRSFPDERFARGLRSGSRHEHVASAGGEHFRHVEAGGAAQHAGDALLEQQALDELRLALVERTRHLHELAFGVLRLDLACPALAPAGLPIAARR